MSESIVVRCQRLNALYPKTLPPGYDAMCAACGDPYMFATARLLGCADPEKYCCCACQIAKREALHER